MKKAIYLVAVATLAFFSCQKQELDPSAKDEARKGLTFKASIEQLTPDTKAAINDNNSLVWAKNDLIGIYFPDWGDKNQPFRLNAADAGNVDGTFTIATAADPSGASATAAYFPYDPIPDPVTATPAYPSDSQNHVYDNVVYYNLKSEYWSYDNGDMLTPLVASISSPDDNINFKHAGGAVKLTLNNLPTGTYKVKMTVVGQQITGYYNIPATSAGTAAMTVNSGADNTANNNITLNTWKSNGVFSWIFPVPELTTPKLQFEVTDNNGVPVWSKKLKAQSKDVGRGDILVMPAQTITPYEKFVQDDACTWSFCGKINGSSWQNDIPMVSDGKYWILAGMVFADGDEFKIRKDKKWTDDGGDEYPDKNSENWKFNSTNAGTKDIIFNSETKEIKVVAHGFPYPEVDLSSLSSSSININGDMSDWTFINSLASNNNGTGRIRSWKYTSTDDTLFFFFVLRKNRMSTANTLSIGFDYTDGGAKVDNLNGYDTYVKIQPFTNASQGTPTCINGTISTANINGTDENGLTIKAYGLDPDSSATGDSADYYLEVSIPRSILTGLPNKGTTVSAGAGCDGYNTGFQSITL